MTREELTELHYITPIANVPSILEHGILSHRRAAGIHHTSVAKKEVQEIRRRKVVPPGRPLHEYANLYICARNPMLFLILKQRPHDEMCVLRVTPEVLDLPGVVISDQNAASDHALFGRSPEALGIVDAGMAFAEYWTHPGDQIAEWRHRSVKCAEVLVPDGVPPRYIIQAYVSTREARESLVRVAPELDVAVNAHFFFR